MRDSEDILVEAVALGKRVAAPDGRLTILDDISFVLRRAEALAVLGVSGSGKSTLLGLVAGLDTPSSGSVRVEGADLAAMDEDARAALRNRLVGFVFQSFQLLASLTALENVMLPLELAGAAEARERAAGALSDVGLGARLNHYPAQLSGGEQQRVAIARAFVTMPRLLLADEPTGNLDDKSAGAVADLLFSLREQHNTSLMLVTHDQRLAGRCDRILQLAGGRLA